QIPCYQMQRIVVTPPGHPLLKEPQLTIDSIGRYPLILYGEGYSGRSVVDSAFRNANLTPKVILRAIDADVSKTYVELGLGIAILASITFDPLRDTGLRCIPAHHLFSASPLGVVLRPHSYLRHFAFALIRLFAPHITQIQIQQALNRTRQNFDPPPVL